MTPGIIALIIAGITLAGAIVKFGNTLTTSLKDNHLIIKGELEAIHILVNDRMTQVLNRVDQLTLALEDADIDVPRRPTEREEYQLRTEGGKEQ